jgi:FAD:protein FMN transferase
LALKKSIFAEGWKIFSEMKPLRSVCRLLVLLLIAGASFSCREFAGRAPAQGDARPQEKLVPHLKQYEFSRPQMGVPFRIVLFAPDAETAEAAAEAAFTRIAELNQIFSDYEHDSELSALSRASGKGAAVPVSAELWHVLSRAQELAEKTGGAFDITVGPSVGLWRKARREQRMPRPDLLAETRQRVGYRHLRLDPGRQAAELLVPGMRLDLGGIAKGYAIDAALAVLRSSGIRSALVSGGGDLAVSDPPPGKDGWRIEVAPLDVPNAPPARFVLLKQAAMATSGDVFQKLEIEGARYSHIVDPRTGIGLTDHSLITIIAPDATTADSLATAVSVLGPGEGMKLVEQTPGTAALIVRKPGAALEEFQSKRLRNFLERRKP